MSEYINMYYDIFTSKYLPKIVIAGILLLIGYFTAKIFKKIISKHLSKTNPIAQNFVSNVVFFVIFIPFIAISATKIGMNTSSIAAIVGSAGIAIGLAFQPSLSNISSGLMIVLFRPFKINDYVEADGIAGNVRQIGLFSTSLLKADNTIIIIPNSRVMSAKIINFSDQKIRRVDIDISIEYQEDIKRVKAVVMDILLNDNRILNYPSPSIVISELKDYGFILSIRPWTSYLTYWDLLYDLQEEIKMVFAKNNIKIARALQIMQNNKETSNSSSNCDNL